MAEVEREADGGVSPLGVFGQVGIVQPALQQVVALPANLHDGLNTSADVDLFHEVDVFLQQAIDRLDPGGKVKGLILVGGVELGDNAVQLGVDKLDDSVDKVAKVGQELAVVGQLERLPLELGIASFRSVREEVVPPDGWRKANLLSLVAKDTDAS